MTRDEIFDALCRMPAGQLDLVLAKLNVPTEYLPGPQAPQGTRVAEAVRYLERHGRLMEVAELVRLPVPLVRAAGRRRLALGLVAAIGASAVVMGVAFALRRAPPKFIPLLWVPTVCRTKQPAVGYGNCAEVRALVWLQGQMNMLKAAGVRGFVDLPQDPTLEVTDSGSSENWLLYVRVGDDRFPVGVGYDNDTRGQDGCLRLYDGRTRKRRSAKACLGMDGQWWVQDDEGDSYRSIGR